MPKLPPLPRLDLIPRLDHLQPRPQVLALDLPEAVEIELTDEGGEVVVLEKGGDGFGREDDGVFHDEGVAFAGPAGGVGGEGILGLGNGERAGKEIEMRVRKWGGGGGGNGNAEMEIDRVSCR